MSDKTKNVVVTITFLVFIILIFLINLLKPSTEISQTERRKLAQFPEITAQKILNGSFSKEFENYVTDQIVKREEFRKLKSVAELNLFRKKDNNGIYEYKDSIVKIEYPLNENSILNATNKINEIQKNYFAGKKSYYAIVPDKNYFTDKTKYISMDYEKLEQIMKQNMQDIEYINLFDCLELEDYYRTDIHWKQENLQKVVDKISKQMGFKNRLTKGFTKEPVIESIQKASVYSYETNKETSIYDKEKLSSNDKYDIYLSGPTPLITITNPEAKTDKELIVFRDSFASSLVPLFTEAYHKITLIDIRYMRSKDIEKYIEIKDQEILYLYSTLVLNNSNTLK